jgi:hypothetical protein
MSATPHNGGPAFPSGKSESPGYENSLPYYEGMTLRDWFAGQALAQIGNEYIGRGQVTTQAQEHSMTLAAHAYNIADAMLAARKESTNQKA